MIPIPIKIITINSLLINSLYLFFKAINGSEAGLVISSAMSLTGYFQWAIRQSAESENQMTSVERVIEYSKLPSEAPLESEKG